MLYNFDKYFSYNYYPVNVDVHKTHDPSDRIGKTNIKHRRFLSPTTPPRKPLSIFAFTPFESDVIRAYEYDPHYDQCKLPAAIPIPEGKDYFYVKKYFERDTTTKIQNSVYFAVLT